MSRCDLRVAVVGAGPAGIYATAALIEDYDLQIEVDVFDSQPVPWGLVRSGVAPDHAEKKQIVDRYFDFVLKHQQVRFIGNVTIGRDLDHAELARRYDAVIYAVGATGDVRLGIPGENLAGSHSAREFVAFYNGHPDFADQVFDLACKRAVIIGNGNVALDVARILGRPVAELRATDISDRALRVLEQNELEEIVVVGRRGPENAAFNCPELEEFLEIGGIDVSVVGAFVQAPDGDFTSVQRRKLEILKKLSARPRVPGNRRVVLRFHDKPIAIEGQGRVEGVLVQGSGSDRVQRIEAGAVFRSIGYWGLPFPGLPYDPELGTIRNVAGRVVDEHGPVTGAYVTGWAKRGCRGVIGSNRKCARETVGLLLADYRAGKLPLACHAAGRVRDLVESFALNPVLRSQWHSIDRAERLAGQFAGRPRIKFTTRPELMAVAVENRRAEPAVAEELSQ